MDFFLLGHRSARPGKQLHVWWAENLLALPDVVLKPWRVCRKLEVQPGTGGLPGQCQSPSFVLRAGLNVPRSLVGSGFDVTLCPRSFWPSLVLWCRAVESRRWSCWSLNESRSLFLWSLSCVQANSFLNRSNFCGFMRQVDKCPDKFWWGQNDLRASPC